MSNNAQLVINKDTELLQYQYNKKQQMREQGQSTTFQDTGKSLFQNYQEYDTELNTYMKNQR